MQKCEIWEKHPRHVLSTADFAGGGFLQKIRNMILNGYSIILVIHKTTESTKDFWLHLFVN